MKKLLLPLSVVLSLSLNAADRLDCSDEIAKTPAKAFEYVVTCDRPDGIYRCGETATVNVRVRNATTGAPVSVGKVRVELDALDNRVFRTEEHDLEKGGGSFAVKGTLAKPGFLRLKLHKDDEAKFKPWCVAFDPDGIPAGVDDPADFDAFWANAYAKYAKDIPLDFEKRFDADLSSPWNDVYRFSFNAPDGKTRLYGFISYPKDRSKKYPARFEVPSAGVGGWTLGPSPYQRDRTVNVLLNIFPFEENANVVFNSSTLYDLPLLKYYAEPLLYGITEASPAYGKARQLLDFLEHVTALKPSEIAVIPPTSIMREFIGGQVL